MQNEKEIYEEFGKKLKKLREESSLTQNEIAAELKISRSALTQYEKGVRKVPLSIIMKFSELFQVSVDELLDINIDKTKHTLITDDTAFIELQKKWQKSIGNESHFTDEEIEQLIDYAKYLISKRK